MKSNEKVLTGHKLVDKSGGYPQVIHKNGRFTLLSLKFYDWVRTLVLLGHEDHLGDTAVNIARFGAGCPSIVFCELFTSKQLTNDSNVIQSVLRCS